MALLTKPYTFSAGATIIAAEHNSNFDVIYAGVNGNLSSVNISPTAAIVLTQISFTTALTMSGAIIKPTKGADVASTAGTITLGEDGNQFDITGTAAITSITAKTAGTFVYLQFDSTASLVDGSNLKLAGNFQGAAESTITLYCDGTNWYELSRSPGYTATVSNALSGSVIQTVHTAFTAFASGTTQIPADNSIPQISEGDEYMTRAITPNNASNLLKITANMFFSASNGATFTVALFQDATAGALAAQATYANNANPFVSNVTLIHYMTAGTTSSTTFRIRIGPSSGVTTYFNSTSNGTMYNGVAHSSMIVEEIKA